MAVLKAQHASVRLGGAVVMDLADFKEEGAKLLAEARVESDKVLREARNDAARIRAKALEEGRAEGLAAGHAEGYEAGRAEGEAQSREEVKVTYADRLAELTQRWTEALTQWEASRDALMREGRRGTIRLALGVAARIVRRTIAADPEVAAAQLEAALELLGKSTAVTVACSEDDRRLLEQALPTLLERLGQTTEVTFVVEAELHRGDIVVRVAEGGVDATLSTQLDRLTDALLPGSGLASGDREPLP